MREMNDVRLVTGLLTPDKGEVTFQGPIAASLQAAGCVPPHWVHRAGDGLFPHLTCIANVSFMASRKSRARETQSLEDRVGGRVHEVVVDVVN